MKVSLRKAHALQSAIGDAINGKQLALTVQINEFETVDDKIEKACSEFRVSLAEKINLLDVLYSIRAKVGKAKELAGVGEKLAESALIDKKIALLSALNDSCIIESIDVLKRKVALMRETPVEKRTYGFTGSINTGFFRKEEIVSLKDQIKVLKKQKQKLNDEVLELNIKTEISLNEIEVQILTVEGII